MLVTEEVLHLIFDVLDKKGYIDIPAYGFSMYPFIKKGDLCRFVPVTKRTVSKGDVLLYLTDSGKLVGHRYYGQTQDDRGFRCKGDTNLGFDPSVHRNQIIGKLVVIQRGHQQMRLDSLSSRLWSGAMVSLPLCSRLLNYWIRKKYTEEQGTGVRPHVSKVERS